jgi:hypothetical protein
LLKIGQDEVIFDARLNFNNGQAYCISCNDERWQLSQTAFVDAGIYRSSKDKHNMQDRVKKRDILSTILSDKNGIYEPRIPLLL